MFIERLQAARPQHIVIWAFFQIATMGALAMAAVYCWQQSAADGMPMHMQKLLIVHMGASVEATLTL